MNDVNERQTIREYIVRTVTMWLDNDESFYDRITAVVTDAIRDDMGTGVGRDEYVQMLRDGTDRDGYAQTAGTAVRDELREILEESASDTDSWPYKLLVDLLDLDDSSLAQMFGDHYLPEKIDDIEWDDDSDD